MIVGARFADVVQDKVVSGRGAGGGGWPEGEGQACRGGLLGATTAEWRWSDLWVWVAPSTL